ncbi:MAG: prepilin peptidase [Pseudomonadota bacterium]|nr:prepilin peptidase [Pseudomonadota bacterium]
MPLLGALFGVIVGSFLATLCIRWPRGEQVVSGSSRCDGCGRKLRAADLVPVASYVLSRGKCRGCGGSILRIQLAVELAAAALAAAALALQPNAEGAALALFWLLLLAPAILDARHYWLPDRLTLVLALSGLAVGGVMSGVPLLDRLIGGLAGFLALALIALAYRTLRKREGLGGGDAKLLGAIGLWTGWAALPPIVLLAAMAGLAAAIAQRRSATDRMPFGTLLAIGAILWTGLAAAGLRPL